VQEVGGGNTGPHPPLLLQAYIIVITWPTADYLPTAAHTTDIELPPLRCGREGGATLLRTEYGLTLPP